MDINKATVKDLDIIIRMSVKFIESTNYAKYTDANKLARIVVDFLTSEDKVILIDSEKRGFIAGLITPFIFSTNRVATEFGWWVEPEYRKTGLGKALIEAFQSWAKDNDCSMVTLTSLNEDVGKLFERAGYSLYERSYFKEI